jgi:uncharacterized membrane protein YhaH (DUF805 family)
MGSFLGGRSDRWEYWTSVALLTAAGVALPMLHVRAAVAALFVMWLVTWVRRLHDIDMPAWVALIPGGLMVALVGAGVLYGGHEFARALGNSMRTGAQPASPQFAFMMATVLASLFVQYGFSIWLGFKPGSTDENRYGPVPGHRVAKAEK